MIGEGALRDSFMRENTKNTSALLVTDDAAVETAVRAEAALTGQEIELLHGNRAALSLFIDGGAEECFAIIDLESEPGGRGLLKTAGGALPVLAITDRARPWITSMVRRRRIGASLVKPFTTPQFREAWLRVRKMKSRAGRSWH